MRFLLLLLLAAPVHAERVIMEGKPSTGSSITVSSLTASVNMGGYLTVASSVNAGAFYGDASHLSNVPVFAGGAVAGQVTVESTVTVQGNAFSVGGSTFVVAGGQAAVGITPGSFAAGNHPPFSVVGASSVGQIFLSTTAATTAGTVNVAGIGVEATAGNIVSGSSAGDLSILAGAGNGINLSANNGGAVNIKVLPNGNVGIGTASPGYLFTEKASVPSGYMMGLFNTNNTSGDALGIMGVGPNSADTSSTYLRFVDSGFNTFQGGIARNGSGAVAYNTTSDRRVKENIRPSKLSIDDVMRLRVVDFNFKSDNDKHRVNGLIAQDTAKVYPDAVSKTDDGKRKLGPKDQPWGMDYGRLTPLLIKAIQDQQKEIVELRQRLDAMGRR